MELDNVDFNYYYLEFADTLIEEDEQDALQSTFNQ